MTVLVCTIWLVFNKLKFALYIKLIKKTSEFSVLKILRFFYLNYQSFKIRAPNMQLEMACINSHNINNTVKNIVKIRISYDQLMWK
jgi:hypothetical protein